MRTELIILIVFICVAVVTAAMFLLIPTIHKRHKNIVIANSQRLKLLESLNSQYTFHDISASYYYTKTCNSKANFDKLNIYEYFRYVILQSKESIEGLITKIKENSKAFAKYCSDYEALKNKEIPFDNTLKISEERFKEIELKLYEKNKLNPVTDFTIRVSKSYTSPQGRNHYSDYIDFNYEMTIQHYNFALLSQKQETEKKLSKAYQRSLMTDSLRYDVMKRDNFKCVLCGASAKAHQAILHVDHIIPVSKGGKTEMSNLRTLCDRCNLGKRDKYDKYGLN